MTLSAAKSLSRPAIRAFQKSLLTWFAESKRDLPWRSACTPYKTWISEMMLQQTQVKTVLPYFERWMRELPDIRALHAASEHRVLALWQGLGYYSRARQLKKAAAYLIENHGGRLPQTVDEIRRVPGIGPYSAGAILSIAFNRPVPAVDGNVLRVFARLFAIEEPIEKPATRERVGELVAALMPPDACGNFTEALMELGATICLPQNPRCGDCPVSAGCRARAEKIVERLPVRLKKKAVEKVSACAVVLRRNARFFLWKRPVGKIMGGLWEFPEWKTKPGESTESRRRLIARELGIPEDLLRYSATVRRNYTRFAEDLDVFEADWKKAEVPNVSRWESRWLKAGELGEYPLTSAHAKIRARVTKKLSR